MKVKCMYTRTQLNNWWDSHKVRLPVCCCLLPAFRRHWHVWDNDNGDDQHQLIGPSGGEWKYKEMLRVDCIHRQKRRTSWFANYNRTLKFTFLDSSGNLSMNTKHWKTTRRIDQWHLPTLHYTIIIWSSISHRHLHHLGIITTTIQLHIQLHVIVIIM